MKKSHFVLLIAVLGGGGLFGCDSGGVSTKAPPTTGPPRKKWADMTKEEKIAALQKSPAPNKQQLLDQLNAGTY
jgi:hypothetical protein